MIVSARIDKYKLTTKHFAQTFGVVRCDRQLTALLRTVKREGADDGVAARA